jgi:hypothetical protein
MPRIDPQDGQEGRTLAAVYQPLAALNLLDLSAFMYSTNIRFTSTDRNEVTTIFILGYKVK